MGKKDENQIEIEGMMPKENQETEKNENNDTEKDKLKNIVKKARETGKMTYGELAKELEDTSPDKIDEVFDAFEEMGVNLLNDDFEDEPDIDDLKEVEDLKLDKIINNIFE